MKGFIDIQVNGYHGIDFNADQLSDDAMVEACRRMKADGVVQFYPTVITDDLRLMCHRIGRIAQATESIAEVAQMVAGIHVEGPFISGETGYVGAHPSEHVLPATIDAAMRLIESGRGFVRIVTLAPESPGAAELTSRLADDGIVVAGGHSDASRDELRAGIDAGMTLFTHLGNGCPATMHRHDNIVQRVLSLADRLAISLIADGHHVPFFAMANYLRCIPEENVIVISDAITAAGLGPGIHRLAGQEVEVDEDLAAWKAGRVNFAGCATTLPRMQTLLERHLDATPEQLRRWLHDNPKRIMGD